MTKLRKQRKRKVYRASVNRKRLRNRMFSKGVVKCPEIKAEWEKKMSAKRNLENMGLVVDPNKSLKRSNIKAEMISKFASTSKWEVIPITEADKKIIPTKAHVVELLEKEAKAPRLRMFQLPSSQVEWITYLLDKYGTDYKAMARDKRNHYQETWKQIRAKIKVFMGIPEQYGEYLESRGLLDKNIENEVNHLIESDDEL